MARKRTLIGAAVLLGAAIAVPATAAFAWGDDPPKPPAPPASPPTVVPDPVTAPTIQGKKPQDKPTVIVVHTSAPKGWAPPPLPIPPGRPHGKAPAPAKSHSAEPPQDQSPPPPPTVDPEPEDAPN